MDNVPASVLRDLLLHKLSAAEAEPLEDRIVQDAETADLLEVAIGDLIDDYARGRLNSEDSLRVEQHLLTTPDGAERLAFARAFSHYRSLTTNHSRSGARSFGTWQLRKLIAGLAASFALVALLVISQHRPGVVTRQAYEASTIPPSGTGSGEMPSSHNGTQPGTFVVALLASQTRGIEAHSFMIPEDAELVRLQCEIPASAVNSIYRVALTDSTGRVVLSEDDTPSRRAGGIAFVEAQIPAKQLSAGDYRLSVYWSAQPKTLVVTRDFMVKVPIRRK